MFNQANDIASAPIPRSTDVRRPLRDAIHLEVVTLGQVRFETELPWSDPHGIAKMDQAKRTVFLTNPFSSGDSTPVQILAVQGDRVVGRVDLLPGRVVVDGEPIETSWGSGMFVPPAMRGQGIGRMLAEHREHVHPTRLSCGVSMMLLPIYRSRGWQAFQMTRQVLLRSARPVAERYLGKGILSRVGTTAGNTILRLSHSFLASRAKRATRDYLVEQSPVWPSDVAIPSIAAAAHTDRSPAIVDWMLQHQFSPSAHAKQTLWLIREARHGEVAGYFLTKTRFHNTASHRGFRNVTLVSLQDWMSFQPAELGFREMILCAAANVLRTGVDGLEVCVPPSEAAVNLRSLGFLHVGAQQFLYSGAPGSPLADPRFRDPKAWWFRPGDGDNVFV